VLQRRGLVPPALKKANVGPHKVASRVARERGDDRGDDAARLLLIVLVERFEPSGIDVRVRQHKHFERMRRGSTAPRRTARPALLPHAAVHVRKRQIRLASNVQFSHVEFVSIRSALDQ
jgi:hypothetical protein